MHVGNWKNLHRPEDKKSHELCRPVSAMMQQCCVVGAGFVYSGHGALADFWQMSNKLPAAATVGEISVTTE
jgi:hypothetical protein